MEMTADDDDSNDRARLVHVDLDAAFDKQQDEALMMVTMMDTEVEYNEQNEMLATL